MAEKYKKNEALLLLIVLVLALYFRLQNIGFGLPFVLALQEADQIASVFYVLGNLLTPNYSHIPDLFTYLNTVFISLVNGIFFNAKLLVKQFELDPGYLIVPLRAINFLFSIGCIFVTYLIGKRLGGYTGLIAAFIFSFSLLHVVFSHIYEPLGISLFFMLMSTLFALMSDKNSTLLKQSLIFAFISMFIHFIGILSLISWFIFYVFNQNKDKELIRFFITFLVIYVLLNPLFVFRIPLHIQHLFNFLSSGIQYSKDIYLIYAIKVLSRGIGSLFLISILFLPFFIKDYDKKQVGTLFIFPTLALLILFLFQLKPIVYFLLIVPYVCIAAGMTISSAIEQYGGFPKGLQLALIFIGLLAIWLSVKSVLNYNRLSKLPDTRVMATEWIKRKVNQHYTVAWDRSSIQLNKLDVLDKRKLGKAKNLVKRKRKYVRRQFIISEKLLRNEFWYGLLKKKADYVVISSIDSERAMRNKKNLLKKKYYKELSKLNPEVTFNPYYQGLENKLNTLFYEDLFIPYGTLWKRERFGPVIKIYKL